MTNTSNLVAQADAVLIGGGIASATLAALLTELQPNWRIVVVERLAEVGLESSAAWNNAGTGHSALCELNYTPQDVDGSVDPAKAMKINSQFQLSREFWSYLVENDRLADPADFIRPVPHLSFVQGIEDADFLRRRHAALVGHPLFASMEFTTRHLELREWAPLICEDRPITQSIAATRSLDGTDVNFGALTTQLLAYATREGNTELITGHEVTGLRRLNSGGWGVMFKPTEAALERSTARVVRAPFVFVGAGGAALPLLQKAGIPEAHGFGGFPISGQWLRCTNEAVIARHEAKVYGKAAVGAPPMSVPHLDTRFINGRRELMFGPYAGWSPKFLKTGSVLDLPASVRPGNVLPMMQVGVDNLDLSAYLLSELAASRSARLEALRSYMPSARDEDWELVVAGQRVQVIAPHPQRRGVLQFGTQLVTAADGSLSGMLGASPGASTAVSIMTDVLQSCFPQRTQEWAPRLNQMLPSLNVDLIQDRSAAQESLDYTREVLGLS